jgi:hypothetical protein
MTNLTGHAIDEAEVLRAMRDVGLRPADDPRGMTTVSREAVLQRLDVAWSEVGAVDRLVMELGGAVTAEGAPGWAWARSETRRSRFQRTCYALPSGLLG